MKNYFIKVLSDLPYPVEREYRVEANQFATAIRRAVKEFRAEKKGRKIEKLRIEATKI